MNDREICQLQRDYNELLEHYVAVACEVKYVDGVELFSNGIHFDALAMRKLAALGVIEITLDGANIVRGRWAKRKLEEATDDRD